MEQEQTQESVQEQTPELEPTSEKREAVEKPSRWKAFACWACCVLAYLLGGLLCGFFCGYVFGNAFFHIYWNPMDPESVFNGRDAVPIGAFFGTMAGMALGLVTGTFIGGYAATVRGAFKRWFKIFAVVFSGVLLVMVILGTVLAYCIANDNINITNDELGEVLMMFTLIGIYLGIDGGLIGATIGCLRCCDVKMNTWDTVTVMVSSLVVSVVVGLMAIMSISLSMNILESLFAIPAFLTLGVMVCAGFCLKDAKRGARHGSLIGLVTGPLLGLAVGSLMVGKISVWFAILGAFSGVAFGAICGLVIRAGIAAGRAAGMGRLCVICVLLGAVLGALWGDLMSLALLLTDVTPHGVILAVTFFVPLGAMFSAMIALETGIGPLLGSRNTEVGVQFGLVFGVMVPAPLAALEAACFLNDEFLISLLGLLSVPFSMFVFMFLGSWLGRKFGPASPFGAWTGTLVGLLALSFLMLDREYLQRTDVLQWGVILAIGMVVGAAFGALLGKPSNVECGDNAP